MGEHSVPINPHNLTQLSMALSRLSSGGGTSNAPGHTMQCMSSKPRRVQIMSGTRQHRRSSCQKMERRRGRRARRLRLEPLEARVLLAFDFGDAPEPYPTTLVEDGARHGATGPTLGATRDPEDDGIHSADADADGTDENGVDFGSIRVGQLDATVIVDVQGQAGKLDAWVDFNGDGSWGGPFEHIFRSVDVSPGTSLHTFDVPSWAVDGTTYARFRLSTEGHLGVGGEAVDGEVEDYQLTINPPVAATGSFLGPKVIATIPDVDDPTSVFAADVNRDGLMDIVAASHDDDRLAWYQNDGDTAFTAHDVSVGEVNGPSSVFVADVDGDGNADVLAASRNDNDITWFENDGGQRFAADTIYRNAANAESVFAADMDGDGDMDVISAASGTDDEIAWYENDGSESFTYHTISRTAENARSVFAADVDGDGDMDVLSASEADDTIAWYENSGSKTFARRNITTDAEGARSVFAADVDGDGDMDVLSASYNGDTIAWHENNGNAVFVDHHEITNGADGASSVFAVDMDGDGDMDVLAASERDDTIAWYENDGNQNFAPHSINTAADEVHSVFAADVDGDGDMDVVSASRGDHTIAWYENEDPPSWQNPDDRFDVDGVDGPVPLDILILVSYLNSQPDDPSLPAPPNTPPPFYDVNDDGWCTPLDVVLLIDKLNENARTQAEGEAAPDARFIGDGCRYWTRSCREFAEGRPSPRAAEGETNDEEMFRFSINSQHTTAYSEQVFRLFQDENSREDWDQVLAGDDLPLADIIEDIDAAWH